MSVCSCSAVRRCAGVTSLHGELLPHRSASWQRGPDRAFCDMGAFRLSEPFHVRTQRSQFTVTLLSTFTSTVYTLPICPLCFNRPLIPFRLPHHWLQRALNRQHLTQRTLRKRHGTLVLGVECIILAFHRVPQIPHASVWMQFLPRSCARATFAALEREQQSIQARSKRCDGPVTYSR
jgi:hypothetical protein